MFSYGKREDLCSTFFAFTHNTLHVIIYWNILNNSLKLFFFIKKVKVSHYLKCRKNILEDFQDAYMKQI